VADVVRLLEKKEAAEAGKNRAGLFNRTFSGMPSEPINRW
jgi:hypothetical protein